MSECAVTVKIRVFRRSYYTQWTRTWSQRGRMCTMDAGELIFEFAAVVKFLIGDILFIECAADEE